MQSTFLSITIHDSSQIIVHNTGEWPTNGRFIPAGNSITVAVEASQYKTSKRLRNLSPEDRQCYYDDLSIADEITDKVLHLKGLPYLRPNCIVECRRYYMMKYCNCSVSFFYPGKWITFNFIHSKVYNRRTSHFVWLQIMDIHRALQLDWNAWAI